MWEIRDCLKFLFNIFSKTNNWNLLGDVCGEALKEKWIMSRAICSDKGNTKFEGVGSNVLQSVSE